MAANFTFLIIEKASSQDLITLHSDSVSVSQALHLVGKKIYMHFHVLFHPQIVQRHGIMHLGFILVVPELTKYTFVDTRKSTCSS
jgi:hypothetical protein